MNSKIFFFLFLFLLGKKAIGADHEMYQFDYNKAIVEFYKPTVLKKEFKHDYRKYISKLQQDIQYKFRKDKSSGSYKGLFESILTALAFVDANYGFGFDNNEAVGQPYSSMTYINQMYEYKIPAHIIYEVQLYRWVCYTNTFHPKDYRDNSDKIKSILDKFASYVYILKDKHPYLVNRLFEYQLYFKNMSLVSEIEVKSIIDKFMIDNHDGEIRKLYKKWKSEGDEYLREQLYYVATTKLPLSSFPVDEGAIYGNGYLLKMNKITTRQCQHALPPGVISVEIKKFNFYETDSLSTSFKNLMDYSGIIDKRYVALILTKDSLYFEKLTTTDILEIKQYNYYRHAVKFQIMDTSSYGIYWKGIDEILTNKRCTKVLVSPDGVFNIINLNILKRPSGDFLINSYSINRVINSKALFKKITNRKNGKKRQSAVLMGYPNYDFDNDAIRDSTIIKSSLIRDM